MSKHQIYEEAVSTKYYVLIVKGKPFLLFCQAYTSFIYLYLFIIFFARRVSYKIFNQVILFSRAKQNVFVLLQHKI